MGFKFNRMKCTHDLHTLIIGCSGTNINALGGKLMEISVAELLSTKLLEDSKVLAGEEGLNRLVCSVTVIENSDAIEWLQGNEFVVTNGFGLNTNLYAQESFVDNLVKKRAAGLAIKLRYLGELPDIMKQRANALGFPIISVDERFAWRDIIEHVLNNAHKKQTKQLERKEHVYRNFLGKAMQEDTLLKVAQELYLWTGIPTTIFNLRTNQLFSQPNEFSLPEGLLSNRKHWRVKKKHHTLDETNYILVFNWVHNNVQYCWTGVEIKIDGFKEGYIWMWITEEEIKQNDLTCLDYAISAVSMELKHIKLMKDINLKYRNQFLYFVLQGSHKNFEDLYHKSKEVGWFPEDTMAILIMEFVTGKDNKQNFVITRAIEEILREIDPSNHCFFGWDNDKRLVIILSGNQGFSYLADSLLKEFKKYLPNQVFATGLGTMHGILKIRLSYEEAIHTAFINDLMHNYNRLNFYKDLGIYRILKKSDMDSYISFYNEILFPLVKHDQKNNTNLVETINTFVTTGYNYRETAKRLFLHQNSIRYRINTIEQICNISFKLYDHRLNIEVALKLLPLFNKEF